MSSESKNGLRVLMEFIGTFILSGAINLSTTYTPDGGQVSNPLLIILAFYTAVTFSRRISGGHVNPAVTLAVYFEKTKEERSKEQSVFTLYVIGQVLGALCSCLFSYIFYREHIFKLALGEDTTAMNGFLIEIIGTFIFAYTILCQGDPNAKLTTDSSISTLIIALALFAAGGIAGNISGGCLNPAIGFAHNFVRLLVTQNPSECKHLWVYILGPSIGGWLAAYVYKNFFRKFFLNNKTVAYTI